MRKTFIVLLPLLLLTLILNMGCVSETGAPATPTPRSTLPPVVTTPTPAPLRDETILVSRDAYESWEFNLHIGTRYAVEVVTDGAPVDLVVLDLPNYQRFYTAFYSHTGSPWEESVLFVPGTIDERREFKVSLTGKYRVIIENADIIKGGATTSRDVNVIVRFFDLD